MSRGRNMILFGLLMINISLLVAAEEETQSYDDCADVRNTTLLQREDLLVQFLLLTRGNPDCAQMFNDESLTDLEQTYFNVNRPTKVVIHGFRATGSKPTWGKELAQALLQAEDANVLMVDWVRAASFAYNRAVENYKEVAMQISYLINKLEELGCKLESFHFIGVSVGAHVAGFVGTIFEGKVGRITALDPAGPMFKGADTFDRLDPSDALFVDAIHTDSDYFGISIPVGNVDFYLNGGEDQTGCARSRFPAVYRYVICDHMRALYVFISSLSSSCQLTGIPCLNYDSFLNGQCVDCDATGGTCPSIGLLENAGIGSAVIPQEQKVYLLTTALPPYCVQHILVELEISRLSRKAELEVTLRTGNMTTKQTLQLSTNTLVYKRVLGHPTALCEINSIEIKNTGSLFLTQKDVNILSICLSEIPYVGAAERVCMENVAVSRRAPWSHDLVQVCDA